MAVTAQEKELTRAQPVQKSVSRTLMNLSGRTLIYAILILRHLFHRAGCGWFPHPSSRAETFNSRPPGSRRISSIITVISIGDRPVPLVHQQLYCHLSWSYRFQLCGLHLRQTLPAGCPVRLHAQDADDPGRGSDPQLPDPQRGPLFGGNNIWGKGIGYGLYWD
jgi:hypothetical protein